MEEQVGELWHKLVTRLADTTHRDAEVKLGEVAPALGVFFRALGGDGGLQVEAAQASAHGGRRGWLQRLAGSGARLELAWRDERSLRLPASIGAFDRRELNRDLYFWLAALAAGDDGAQTGDWFQRNQALTRHTLQRWPGLALRYRRLCAAHIATRPDPERLRNDEARAETAVRAALLQPGSVDRLPAARRRPAAVPMWLHPDPPFQAAGARNDAAQEDNEPAHNDARNVEAMARRRATRSDTPDSNRGLVTIRMENILSWGEYVRVDRAGEDEEDSEQAEAVARDLDELALSNQRQTRGARLRFDLDLPASAEDDRVLDEGTLLPEFYPLTPPPQATFTPPLL